MRDFYAVMVVCLLCKIEGVRFGFVLCMMVDLCREFLEFISNDNRVLVNFNYTVNIGTLNNVT